MNLLIKLIIWVFFTSVLGMFIYTLIPKENNYIGAINFFITLFGGAFLLIDHFTYEHERINKFFDLKHRLLDHKFQMEREKNKNGK